jgi:pimeloyl-ACP methyl ester carboxylesterase
MALKNSYGFFKPWSGITVAGLLILLAGWYYLNESSVSDNTPALTTENNDYRFNLVDCWFAFPEQEKISCGRLITPDKTGGFSLPVVIIHEQSDERRTDPVLYLQGGPGSAAGLNEEGMDYWLAWRDNADFKRDVIFMDPRGTGGSQPQLVCASYDRLSLEIIREDISLQEEFRRGDAAMQACFRQAVNAYFKPEFFGTQQSARDIRGLIGVLPEYSQWNLFGVSYGTRLAITAAFEFPAVRAMVLDSPYPAGRGDMEQWPEVFDQAIQRFANWCDANVECTGESRENFIARLQQVLQQLNEYPVSLSVARWDGEWPVRLFLNDHRFMAFTFSSIYDVNSWLAVSEAMSIVLESEKGFYPYAERTRMAELMQSLVNQAVSTDFFAMVFDAVDCADQTAVRQQAYEERVKEFPLFAAFTGDLWQFQHCDPGTIPAELRLKPDHIPKQPALILSGDLDPITPTHWAGALHQQWPSSQWLEMENTGHAVTVTHGCLLERAVAFFDNPEKEFIGCL